MESGMRDAPLAERVAPSYTLVLFFKMKNIQNKANKQNTPEGKINKVEEGARKKHSHKIHSYRWRKGIYYLAATV